MQVLNNTPLVTELEYRFKQVNFVNWISDFAYLNNLNVTNNKITYPKKIAKGTSEAYHLSTGLSSIIHHYTLNNGISFKRNASTSNGILIQFNNIEALINNTNQINSNLFSIQISSIQKSAEVVLIKNTTIQSISIYVENTWLEKNILPGFMPLIQNIHHLDVVKLMPTKKQMAALQALLRQHSNTIPALAQTKIIEQLKYLTSDILQYYIAQSLVKNN